MARSRPELREIRPADRTVLELLERGASRFGERTLVRFPSSASWTYAGARTAAAARAGSLREAGIERGDRVALMCSNREELVEIVLGCAWLGAIPVPVNTAIRGEQLRHVLSDSGARLAVAQPEHVSAMREVEPTPRPERIWVLDGPAEAEPAWASCSALPPPGEEIPPVDAAPGDVAAILYTSGTTGPSKGVCCPHAQLFWFAVLTAELLEIGAEDVLYTTLPMFHVNALTAMLQALAVGATITVDARFSASRFWERCVETEATVTYLLGAMVSILERREPGPLDRAHRVGIALAPATPPGLLEAFRERFGMELVEGYASTETNVALVSPAGEQRPGMMGYVTEGFEARVVDEQDAEVPDGTPGELVLRHSAPFAFATGYWRLPERTVEAWRNLWFHTGDRVVRDGEGWFRFMDRMKDAIRRRGENISSFEVEHAVLSHEAVAAAAVYPVPSELGEDEVMAAVVPVAGGRLDPAELIRHLEPRLARFAIPRYVEIVDELPMTENGKIRKAELRDRGVTDETWDRESELA